MPRPKTKTEKEEIKTFSFDELHNALTHVEDLMDRALLPMILWGETAHCIFNDELYGERIQVGTYRDHFSKFSTEVLQQYGGVEVLELETSGTCNAILRIQFEGVPIEILSLDRHQKYVDNPDSVRFKHSSYLIPNPIKVYLADLVETF